MTETTANKVATRVVLDARPAKWRVGLIALATDHTVERDFARMCPSDEIAIYVNRVSNVNPTTHENLRKMLPQLGGAAAEILPEESLDVVAYACTSASVVIGEDAVRQAIQFSKPGVPVVTPSSAAVSAFEALGVKRVSLLTPYSLEVTQTMGAYFADQGLELLKLSCFGLEDDRDMARISRQSIVDAAVEACAPEAEAMFLSCTALRAAEAVEEIEARLGIPVVTSNQALFWKSMRVADCDLACPGFGRLLLDDAA